MLSAAFLLDAVKSPPSRGAWIEIEKANVLVTMLGSPPSRGAWIEILYQLCQMSQHDPVAPLAGGVD